MAQLSFISTAKLAELLTKADTSQNTYVHVLTKNLLALGVDPLNPTQVIDLSKEAIRSVSADDTAQEPQVLSVPTTPSTHTPRRTGRYLLDIKGSTVVCRSLKEMLSEGLKALEQHQQGTLTKLSAIKPRSKRIVALDPALLFNKAELVEKYSEKLIDGWWYGTNNSTEETISWLRRASEIAGLEWGKDISTSL